VVVRSIIEVDSYFLHLLKKKKKVPILLVPIMPKSGKMFVICQMNGICKQIRFIYQITVVLPFHAHMRAIKYKQNFGNLLGTLESRLPQFA